MLLRWELSFSVLPQSEVEVYPQLTNMSDYEPFLTYDPFYSEACPDDGCEVEDEDVAMATYVLELVLMPVFGAVGVLGNILSIIVLCKSVDKEATFHHVDMLFSREATLELALSVRSFIHYHSLKCQNQASKIKRQYQASKSSVKIKR